MNINNHLLKIKRRLGELEKYINNNIPICVSLYRQNLSIEAFYTSVVHYTILSFLLGTEWAHLTSSEAFEIRNMLVDFIETNYKDKIIKSYKP